MFTTQQFCLLFIIFIVSKYIFHKLLIFIIKQRFGINIGKISIFGLTNISKNNLKIGKIAYKLSHWYLIITIQDLDFIIKPTNSTQSKPTRILASKINRFILSMIQFEFSNISIIHDNIIFKQSYLNVDVDIPNNISQNSLQLFAVRLLLSPFQVICLDSNIEYASCGTESIIMLSHGASLAFNIIKSPKLDISINSLDLNLDKFKDYFALNRKVSVSSLDVDLVLSNFIDRLSSFINQVSSIQPNLSVSFVNTRASLSASKSIFNNLKLFPVISFNLVPTRCKNPKIIIYNR